MKPGIQVNDIAVGSGEEALRSKTVFVNVRVFLPDCTALDPALMPTSKMRIDLSKRYCIAGIRYLTTALS